MAGIGFVLERVIDRQGLRGVAGAAAAGVLIVAGPWLISTVALVTVSHLAVGDGQRFFAVVVYCYAFSLLLFGGYHYRFTRILADALYSRSYTAVRRVYYRALWVSVLAGLPPALLLSWASGYRGAAFLAPTLLFLAVNSGWIHTLLASILQDYRAILGAYAAGALVATALAWAIAAPGSAGGLVIFAAAMGVTGGVLFLSVTVTLRRRIAAATQLKVQRRGGVPGTTALRRLMVIGWSLAAVLWLDKILLWGLAGAQVTGTRLWLLPAYDQTVFLAQLLAIPPTVYFVIRVETSYFRGLRSVLRALRLGTGTELDGARSQMETRYYDALRGQIALQLLMVGIAALVAPEMVGMGLAGSVPLLIVTAAASQMYFLFYSLVVNLLYLADYREAVRVLLATVALAVVFTVMFALLPGAAGAGAGYGFLAATTMGTVLAALAQRQGLRDLDWLVLTRVNA